jgi:hypothetical protein
MGWMMIWWILGFATIAAVLWVVLAGGRGGLRESPEQILKRRYAAGEIDRETYHRMLTDIRSPAGRGGGPSCGFELRAVLSPLVARVKSTCEDEACAGSFCSSRGSRCASPALRRPSSSARKT